LRKKLKVTEKLCKTTLSETRIPSYDYTINPYTGCEHSCSYCYANFMRRFSGHLQDAWGSFVDVKVNLLDILRRELPKRPAGVIWLSSVCDPYQPVERKYRLTRGVIELLLGYPKFSVSILTKNALVLRDLRLLTRMKNRIDVGFTITTFDDRARSYFEPRSSPVPERIAALEKLSEAGIETWVFFAPMLPYVTEERLEQGLLQLSKVHVKRLLTDRYNARGMIIKRTLQAYEKWRPDLNLEEIRRLLWNGDAYYRRLDGKIAAAWKTMAASATHEAVF
jgi:DNA repair photolyase